MSKNKIKKRKKNYGFIIPEIKAEDYFLGSGKLGSVILNEKGDWREFLPVMELQNRGFEPNACVSFAILSAIEILHKFLYKNEVNYSDRFLAKISNTNPFQGNTPNIVSDSLRHKGIVKEEEYPFENFSLQNYYKEISQELLNKALEWLNNYNFGYEWTKENNLKEALKRSPVGVGVNAWFKNDKNEYTRLGNSNHFVVLIAYDEQNRPVIWDSYDTGIKILEKEYKFDCPQIYTLKKINKIELKKNSISILEKIISLLNKIISLMKKQIKIKKEPIKDILLDNQKDIKDISKGQDMIIKMAEAIKTFEGWKEGSRSFRNNNPGNLKWTSYTQSLGAISKDKNNFCIFQDSDKGFSALCQFIKDAGNNKLKDYHNCTIESFFKVYSDNSLIYANFVAKQIGFNISKKIADML